MTKLKDYIITAIIVLGLAFIYHNDKILSKQIEDLNKPQVEQTTKPEPIQQVVVEEEPVDILMPAPKEQVEAVISEYYSKTVVVSKKTQNVKPAVKIQPKKNKPCKKNTNINLNNQKVIDQIAVYIKTKEGFRAKAYKDNTQYSNGYGTRAKSKTEVITVKEANIRLYRHIKKVIIPSLDGVTFQSIEQVYSAIDFSYNLGHNRFRNNLVREDGTIDCEKMLAYSKMRDKNGNLVYNEGLAQRRLENFLNCASYEIIVEK